VGIRTFARILPKRFEDAELGRFAGLVGVAVDRIAQVVERLSRFAELGAPARAPVDLARLVETLLDAQRAEIQARGLVVLKQLEAEHSHCSGDEAQLRFALEGVLERVLGLVPERGDLYVATRRLERAPGGGPGLRLSLRFRAPQGLAARAGAPGVSLAEAALEFALAEAVVRSHAGRFEVVPGPGEDTTLLVDLPA
jgi:nitrogen-specific signal transduction histidine kinase